MSEFLAEAAVLVRANTALFKKELLAGVASAVKDAEKIARVNVVPVTTGGRTAKQAAADAAVAAGVTSKALNEQTTAAKLSGDAITRLAVKQQQAAASASQLAASTRHARAQQAEFLRGIQAQTLSFAGLRGAIIGANSRFLIATASLILLGKAIKGATDLQTNLATFNVVAGATADEMARVRETAVALGDDLSLPGVSAGDAAQAMLELSKAGLSVTDSLAGAKGVLQLAAAASIDNAQATELAASALNSFGLSGDQAVHVADVLANAANAAQGSISDMGLSLQQASAVARQVGLSLEDTTAILTLFARNGLRGSDAGTAFRTSMIRLIAPSKQAQEVIKLLGLRIRDVNGNVRPDVFAQFGEATRNLSSGVRDAAAALIFGQDAIRAVAIGAREGTTGLRDAQQQMEKTGTAAEVAGAKMSGLAGAARGLGSRLETIATQGGTLVIPFLTDFTNAISSMIDTFNTANAQVERFFSGLQNQAQRAKGFGIAIGFLSQQMERLSRIKIDFTTFDLSKIVTIDPATITGLERLRQTVKELPKDVQPAVFQAAFGTMISGAEDLKQSFRDAGIPLKGINTLLASLQRRLDLAKQGIFITDPNAVGPTALEASLLRAQNLAEQLKTLGLPTDQINRAIDEIQSKIKSAQGGLGRIATEGVPDSVFAPIDQASQKITELLRKARADAEHLSPTDPLARFAKRDIQNIIAELRKLGPEGAAAARTAGELIAKGFSDGLATPQAKSDLELSLAETAGNQSAVLSILREREARQQAFLDAVLKRQQTAKNVALATKASENLGKTRDAIKSIIDQQESDAKQAASDARAKAEKIKSDRAKADQAIIDSFSGEQNKLDLRAIQVGGSDNLKAQLALQVAIANEASREIAIIDKTVKDQKTRDAAVAERVKTLATSGVTITSLLKQIGTKAKERAAAALSAVLDLDKARLELAQLRLGPEGQGKDVVLAAFDKVIADARKQRNATKKASLARAEAEVALQQFINERRDFLKGLEGDVKDTKGTTAFDLLKEFADTFNQNAGNLINQQQPFAGPTGFTADIAQFLVRRPQAAKQTSGAAPVGGKVSLNDQELIAALDRLRISVEAAGGNRAAAGSGTGIGGRNVWSRGAFTFARETRDAIEARSGM